MNNREIAGVKVFVSGETYDEYKGTLQEQIDNLQSKIDKAIEYIINHSEEYKPHFRKIELDTVQCNELLNILEENK